MKIDLSEKNAVVCGSSKGIGKAIALQFAQCGANVTLIARNESELINVLNQLPASGNQKHNYIAADFNYPDVLKQKITEYIVNNPVTHILVNNTGGPKSGSIVSASVSEFETAFRNHLICNQILVQAFCEEMKNQKFGRIINIISTSVKQPIKNLGVSNTIRAAVASWAKTLASELAPFGITVNNILPGATKTDRLFSLFEANAASSGKSVEEIQNQWLNEIPAGRFAEAQEIAFAACFLASSFASYITGINLPVDGGRLNSL